MQEQFNEQNSLALIQSMINKAKNNFSESGTLYLVWGIVVFICSIIQFVGVNILQNDKFISSSNIIVKVQKLLSSSNDTSSADYTYSEAKFIIEYWESPLKFKGFKKKLEIFQI